MAGALTKLLSPPVYNQSAWRFHRYDLSGSDVLDLKHAHRQEVNYSTLDKAQAPGVSAVVVFAGLFLAWDILHLSDPVFSWR